MFNFFEEIKKNIKSVEPVSSYNIVNMSGKIMYVEGHCGLVTLSKEMIAFKVKHGRIIVEGKNLVLNELTETTMKIVGEITKMEAF